MLPEDAEAELSRPHGAAQRAGTMEPPPALSPVLCVVLLIPTWGAGLTVLQSPAVLRASPGETVNLSCSFENRPGSAVNVRWTRAPGVILESNHPFYKGRFKVFFRDLLQKEEVTLTLSDLEKRDSGLYQCHISNRQGESWTGAGTKLQVMGRNQSDTGFPGGRELCRASGPLFYRAVISLLLVVLFSLGIILSLRPWNGIPVDPTVRAGSKPPPAQGRVTLL
ncbi:unnamed protein product [Caretta caretta]